MTTQTIDALVQQQESISQFPVTPEGRKDLIASHIDDEIMLREAYKRGFDKNDYRVRKRILSIMRRSLSDVIPEPSVNQLRAYHEANKDRYLTSPSRTFEQVYFSFSNETIPKDSQTYLQTLAATADIDRLGEYATMGDRFRKMSFQRTAAMFGKPFAQALFGLPQGPWHGPLESFRGFHSVRVTETHAPELPPFEPMESYLRTDYMMVKSRERQQNKIDELRKNHDVIVDGE